MLQFDWPWLFAVLPLPFLAYWLLPRVTNQQAAIQVPFFQLIQQLQADKKSAAHHNKMRWLLMGLLWSLLVTAAAAPTWLGDPIRLPANGRDLLLAVDISGSMKTADMIVDNQQVDRLTIVKAVVGEFVDRREADRLGLILFGTQAYLQAPLTFDRNTVNTLLQEARLGFAGEKTAIGDAIGLATKRLLNRPESQRVLILLTDGANTAGEVDPLQAAQLAEQSKVKIYTIGIGADKYTFNDLFFGRRTINPSQDLDEASLIAIANMTGGQYFRARNPEELLGIYSKLDELEPIAQEAESYRPKAALFYWPLAAAFFISGLMVLLNLFRTR